MNTNSQKSEHPAGKWLGADTFSRDTLLRVTEAKNANEKKRRCKLTSPASAKWKQEKFKSERFTSRAFLGYERHATSCRLLEILRGEYINSTFGIYIHEIK